MFPRTTNSITLLLSFNRPLRSIWSSDGFLTAFKDEPFRGVGMIDFAGSGVVHMTGGAT